MKRVNAMVVTVLVAVGIMFAGCGKPPMPVTVTYRESAVGEGYVAQFHNQTAKYLQVRVQFKNRTLNQENNSYIDLSPNGTTEIGWLEGWKFVSGENISLYHEDYATAQYLIP